ncbi:MAG: SAM-dependent methyltransferase [Spirochaetales bacterium]|nr:SAM-dependent methyltransferase [Spirochaetales bacterium]
MISLQTIGAVKSKFKKKADPFEMKKHESKIIIKEEFKEGLYRIEESSHILIIFGFHLSEGYDLKHKNYFGELKGVFAARSPRRPSPLGTTVVSLIDRKDTVLTVQGLDALDETPVYDIKPHHPDFTAVNLSLPRLWINSLVKTDTIDELLSFAGILHGHYCPGLALGVKASVTAMKCIQELNNDGMENLTAITETNSCFADGIQIITGCTFGNNALVYRDIGKTALTLCRRGDKKGIRVCVRPDFFELLGKKYPEFVRLFDLVIKQRAGTNEDLAAFKTEGRKASFGVSAMSDDDLFRVSEVPAAFLPFAPITESLICPECAESFMASKAVGNGLCRSCAGEILPRLDGSGICCSEN